MRPRSAGQRALAKVFQAALAIPLALSGGAKLTVTLVELRHQAGWIANLSLETVRALGAVELLLALFLLAAMLRRAPTWFARGSALLAAATTFGLAVMHVSHGLLDPALPNLALTGLGLFVAWSHSDPIVLPALPVPRLLREWLDLPLHTLAGVAALGVVGVLFIQAWPALLQFTAHTRSLATLENDLQWDLKVYYRAAQAWRGGLDPYVLSNLNVYASGRPVVLNFVYPPVAVALLAPLTWWSLESLSLLWMLAKLGALAYLVWLWRAHILPAGSTAIALALLAVGFNGAVFTDLVSGNLSGFEQVVLWTAFVLLLKGRSWVFAILIGAVAAFKLLPLVFLTLLLVFGGPRRGSALAVGLLVFGGLMALGELLVPGGTATWWARAATLDPRGSENPSLLALVRDSFPSAAEPAARVPPVVGVAVYVGIALCVALSSLPALVRGARQRAHQVPALLLAVAAYVITAPRMKDYSYEMAVVGAAWVVARRRKVTLSALMLLALLCAGPSAILPGAGSVWRLITAYAAYLQAFIVWALLLHDLQADLAAPGPASVGPAAPQESVTLSELRGDGGARPALTR